jgi:hypothetical protein
MGLHLDRIRPQRGPPSHVAHARADGLAHRPDGVVPRIQFPQAVLSNDDRSGAPVLRRVWPERTPPTPRRYEGDDVGF